MKIGRELYQAESDEIKAQVDWIREEEKENAITELVALNKFATDEERLQVMQKYDR